MHRKALYSSVLDDNTRHAALIEENYQRNHVSHTSSPAVQCATSSAVNHERVLSLDVSNCSKLGAQFEERRQRTINTYQLVITHDEHGSHTKFEPKLSLRDSQLLAKTIRPNTAAALVNARLRVNTSIHDQAAPNQVTPRMKRSRALTPPPTPQSSDGQVVSHHDFETMSGARNESKWHDEPIESYLNEDSVDITDHRAVTELLECLFDILHQGICRSLAKVIIKAIEPDKQSAHPYRREAQKADIKARSDAGLEDLPRPVRTSEWSTWWPDEVTYKGEIIPMHFIEPDHLHKSCRVSLLIHMLRLPHTSSEYYEAICQQDIALHGTRSWSNWAEWLSRRIDQIELGDKHNRRNRNGLDVNRVRDANELKNARKAVLDVILRVIASEEAVLSNPSAPVVKQVKFKIPPLLLKAYRKFQFDAKQPNQSLEQELHQSHVQIDSADSDLQPSKRRFPTSAKGAGSPQGRRQTSPASPDKSSRSSTEDLTDINIGRVKSSSRSLTQAISSRQDHHMRDIPWSEPALTPLNMSFLSVDSGYESPYAIFSDDHVDGTYEFGRSATFNCPKLWEASAAPITVGLDVPATAFAQSSSQWNSGYPVPPYGPVGASSAPPLSLTTEAADNPNYNFAHGTSIYSLAYRPDLYGDVCSCGQTAFSQMHNTSFSS